MSWQLLIDGLTEAVRLIVTGDREIIEITIRSLQVAFLGTLMATVVGLPLGILVGMKSFKGKRVVKTVFNALIGIPTVSLGLLLYIFLSHSGPLGFLDLLYTVQGIAVGEAILVTPMIVSFVASAIESKGLLLRDLVRTLGASEFETSLAILREAYSGVSLAVISSFNRAFAELGIAMMIGANIKGVTRVLTTAIALQSAMGEIGLSLALSFILIIVVLTLNLLISFLQRGE
ncbi:ABC transporter permease [Candidatus Bathyarchaeota archaeon]|nr:ABC transporter permease [Candidatus Bathyarchaeota archaeon]MBS7631443.1 ABC transporter permease [Candidatus Bathyarchaeota archaeon]